MSIVERYGTVLRLYDNGGRTADRYTVIPPRWADKYRDERDRRLFMAIGCDESPFRPQGIGMVTTAMPGAHLGKRIKWGDVPADVQRLVRDVFPEYCPAGAIAMTEQELRNKTAELARELRNIPRIALTLRESNRIVRSHMRTYCRNTAILFQVHLSARTRRQLCL